MRWIGESHCMEWICSAKYEMSKAYSDWICLWTCMTSWWGWAIDSVLFSSTVCSEVPNYNYTKTMYHVTKIYAPSQSPFFRSEGQVGDVYMIHYTSFMVAADCLPYFWTNCKMLSVWTPQPLHVIHSGAAGPATFQLPYRPSKPTVESPIQIQYNHEVLYQHPNSASEHTGSIRRAIIYLWWSEEARRWSSCTGRQSSYLLQEGPRRWPPCSREGQPVPKSTGQVWCSILCVSQADSTGARLSQSKPLERYSRMYLRAHMLSYKLNMDWSGL